MGILGQLIKVIVMEFIEDKVEDGTRLLIETAEEILDSIFDA